MAPIDIQRVVGYLLFLAIFWSGLYYLGYRLFLKAHLKPDARWYRLEFSNYPLKYALLSELLWLLTFFLAALPIYGFHQVF